MCISKKKPLFLYKVFKKHKHQWNKKSTIANPRNLNTWTIIKSKQIQNKLFDITEAGYIAVWVWLVSFFWKGWQIIFLVNSM